MNLKRLFLFASVILSISISSFGQYTLIPDPNFEQVLIDLEYDSGSIDGQVLTANISGVQYLDVEHWGITDLTGIQDFAALIELNCGYNSLTELDMSSNTSLVKLICCENNLSSLDVSSNSQLEELNCEFNTITALDVGSSLSLTRLMCLENAITNLDVTNNQSLTVLDCEDNQLTSLDVTNNLSLKELDCGGNFLESLDVSNNLFLKKLGCGYQELESLDVSENVLLETLNCSGNYFETLDLSSNTSLISLLCSSNSLTNLDLSALEELETLWCSSNYLQVLDLTMLPSLKVLSCRTCQLAELNLSGNDSLTTIDCGYNNLISLNLSSFSDLKTLICSGNEIQSIDLTSNTKLTYFLCDNNNLVNLNIANGNNGILSTVKSDGNPNLYCAAVDDPGVFGDWISQSNFFKDPQTYFSSVCGDMSLIAGHVFYDSNQNGIQDTLENGVIGASIVLEGGNKVTTNEKGDFRLFSSALGDKMLSAQIPRRLNCDKSDLINGAVTYPANNERSVTISSMGSAFLNNDFGIWHDDEFCGRICGVIFNDSNHNGLQDTGENGVRGVRVTFIPGGSTISGEDGSYCFLGDFGTSVEVKLEKGPPSESCVAEGGWVQTFPAGGASHHIINSGNPEGVNFGIDNNIPDYDLGIYTIRPYPTEIGEAFKVFMDYKRFGSVDDTCHLVLDFDVNLDVLTTSRTPYQLESGRLHWIFPPGTAPAWECMGITMRVLDFISEGDVLKWNAHYYCGSDSTIFVDRCGYNNEMTREIRLDAANVKAVSTNDMFNSVEMYANGQFLSNISPEDTNISVVINYRNETLDTVYHLYIIDTLSDHMNLESVTRPFSNFPFEFTIVDDSVLIWEITDIVIPPYTTDPLNSYGFVQYNVALKRDLPVGSEISNNAIIRYNYNGEVILKPAVVTIDEVTGANGTEANNELNIILFPNPTSDGLTIALTTARDFSLATVELVNILGERFKPSCRELSSGTFYIEPYDLSSGIYLVNLWDGEQLVGSSRLIKE